MANFRDKREKDEVNCYLAHWGGCRGRARIVHYRESMSERKREKEEKTVTETKKLYPAGEV